MMVDRYLLDVIASLQRKHGEAFASEAGLRRMICEDSGHMPGVDTVPCALERLADLGLLTQQWLKPGGLLPDGSPCTYGTRLVVIPKCRQQRRGLWSRARRREGITGRVDARQLATLEQARKTIAKTLAPPPAPPTDRSIEAKRAEDLERLAALQAKWSSEDKPPD